MNLETVSFYLWRKESLIEYSPDGIKQEFHVPCVRFVRMGGVSKKLSRLSRVSVYNFINIFNLII